MGYKRKIHFISILLIVLVILFIIIGLNENNWRYALSRRIPKIIGIILTGSSIAFSSVVFQTITNNRILTPSVLGLDSLYIFIQTFIVFIFGSNALIRISQRFNFILAVGFMVIFSIILFKLLFKRENNNIFFLLLFGMVFGTFFQSLSSFMQFIIDPNEFMVVQNRMFASFNNMNSNILWLALAGKAFTMIYTYRFLPKLDVLSLGRENAINLGVDYDMIVKNMLIVISILVSISTALVGPITFLGLLVVNITRNFLDTYKHKYLILGSMLISSITLVGGQLIAERIMNFSTPISVVINFVGGIYFIHILLREGKM
ncbi:iron chelate uptake ABC transporter family permease subunit [Clostridium sp. Cult1]|uniref:iron chelate uptake ABC transporter family permease subunit n=1 Tax=Clostridium sp. Cult1 TaxID=2079002 RepID=UPI001EFF9B1A|nr:iron chelate uptake ABC transporter family permease subunit [Clostridium sp. Cult1]MCF6462987.1 iron ABC transporter permease [Clostridium sp. Cult1]